MPIISGSPVGEPDLFFDICLLDMVSEREIKKEA